MRPFPSSAQRVALHESQHPGAAGRRRRPGFRAPRPRRRRSRRLRRAPRRRGWSAARSRSRRLCGPPDSRRRVLDHDAAHRLGLEPAGGDQKAGWVRLASLEARRRRPARRGSAARRRSGAAWASVVEQRGDDRQRPPRCEQFGRPRQRDDAVDVGHLAPPRRWRSSASISDSGRAADRLARGSAWRTGGPPRNRARGERRSPPRRGGRVRSTRPACRRDRRGSRRRRTGARGVHVVTTAEAAGGGGGTTGGAAVGASSITSRPRSPAGRRRPVARSSCATAPTSGGPARIRDSRAS